MAAKAATIPATRISMATIAIGDIHGNRVLLQDLLTKVVPEVRPEDTLVFLGDYIDRGPDSRGCVDVILRLKAEARFRVVTLLGNHEQWMLRSLRDPTRHSWLVGMEALETIESYSIEAAGIMIEALEREGARLFMERMPLPYDVFFDAMPPAHLAFFQQLQPFHQTPDVICVHGGVDLNGVPDPDDENVHVWGPLGFPEDYAGNKAVVYGHRNNAVTTGSDRAQPCIGANRTYGIDTISHAVLTAMRFPDEKVFQSAGK